LFNNQYLEQKKHRYSLYHDIAKHLSPLIIWSV